MGHDEGMYGGCARYGSVNIGLCVALSHNIDGKNIITATSLHVNFMIAI